MASTQPDFTAHRGDLVCRAVHWMDIVRVLVFNFLLHAVSVISTPGEGIRRSIANKLIALFIPMVGTMGAVGTIYWFARAEQTPLAVALCMIEPAVSALTYRLPLHCSLTPLYNGYGHRRGHWTTRAGSRSNPGPPPQIGFPSLETIRLLRSCIPR